MKQLKVDQDREKEVQQRYAELAEHYATRDTRDPPLDKRGHELPDPEPMAPPIGYQPGPDLMEIIRSMVKRASEELASEGSDNDTFEEANDFEIEDEDYYDPRSGYEIDIEGEPPEPPGVKEGTGDPSSARSTPDQVASEAQPAGDLSPAPAKP